MNVLEKNTNIKLNTRIHFSHIENINNICPICNKYFKFGDCIVILNCEHIFHHTCLSNWVQYKQKMSKL